MENILQNYENLKQKLIGELKADSCENSIAIQIGSATCENAAGADKVKKEFEKMIAASGRKDIVIKQTGCTGRCVKEPIVNVMVPGKLAVKYEKVTPEKVGEIFASHIQNGKPVTEYMLDLEGNTAPERVIIVNSENCAEANQKWNTVISEKLFTANVLNDSVRLIVNDNLDVTHSVGGSETGVGFMMIYPDDVIYSFKTVAELDEIVKSQFGENKPCEKHRITTDANNERYFRAFGDIEYFNKQKRIALRDCGIIDPESLSDYFAVGGFEGFRNVLVQANPQQVIKDVLDSGLRGRGGAGFPTGKKWQFTAINKEPVKYIICNADEGDPGAFMDRSVLEGDPFSIVEGMLIGGYAIGACKGFMYIRAEYPLAIKRCQNAIDLARANGLLGENILGSGFGFDIEIRLGAGAFVCGEETALIHSIEGRRGQPRMRPPFPANSGLWGKPTVINNVETWANVSAILRYGPNWFNKCGTEQSKGTKVFALAGNVNNTGLVEVPMGTTLRQVIYDIGGGIPNGRQLKAVQTGGPSGGTIPASLLDTPVDYDTLKAIGSIMGSGGMIVLDDTACMVNSAKFFLEFTKDESCGKCTPCREGTLRMLEILQRITRGEGKMEDLDKLERLGDLVKKTSLCGLGQSTPNPILSTLKHFREEYEIHIKEKRCPTQKCARLVKFVIDEDKCTGCTLCARRCPANAITGQRKMPHSINQDLCQKCGECYHVCNFKAIKKI